MVCLTMTISHTPFPLEWPLGKPRAIKRTKSRFKPRTIARALAVLRDELKRFEARDIVVSTNIEVRIDGLPYAGRRHPDDPGVAVYFSRRTRKGWKPYCMALDGYQNVADNLHAIGLTIEAYRTIERHGGGDLLEQATSGFLALPPPSDKAAKLRALIASTDNDGERAAATKQLEALEAATR